jgi:hypothetical protein
MLKFAVHGFSPPDDIIAATISRQRWDRRAAQEMARLHADY